MGVHVRVKRNRLYLDIFQNGRRTWEALGLTLGPDPALNREAKRLAEAVRLKREMQLLAAANGLLDPVQGKQTLVEYAEALAEKTADKSQLRQSLHRIRAHFGTLQLQAVEPRDIAAFIDSMRAAGLSSAAVSYRFTAVRSVLRVALRDRLIPRDPCAGIRPPPVRVRQEKATLSAEELRALAARQIPGPRGDLVCRAFLLAALTGLRVSDLQTLAWGDVQRDRIMKIQKKTKDKVTIPLAADAWALLDDGRIHHRDELVFPGLRNDVRPLKAWAQRAGVDKPLSWHVARHTFATALVAAGADLYVTSKLLGHKDISTSQRYARVAEDQKKAAVERLPPLDESSKQALG